MRATAELVPMGTITAQLGQRIEVGDGPKGTRLLVDVTTLRWKAIVRQSGGDRSTDWLTVGGDGTVGCVDVRLTLKTDDGAYICRYSGRADSQWSIVTAPTFRPAMNAMRGSIGFKRSAPDLWVRMAC